MSDHRFTRERLKCIEYARQLLVREPLRDGGIPADRLQQIARLSSLEVADVASIIAEARRQEPSGPVCP